MHCAGPSEVQRGGVRLDGVPEGVRCRGVLLAPACRVLQSAEPRNISLA